MISARVNDEVRDRYSESGHDWRVMKLGGSYDHPLLDTL